MRWDDAPDPDLLAIELGLGEFTVTEQKGVSPISGEIWKQFDWSDNIAYTVQLDIGGAVHTRSMGIKEHVPETRREEFVQVLKLLILRGAGLVPDHGHYYSCRHCHSVIDYIQNPIGAMWSHLISPTDEHNAEPDEESMALFMKRIRPPEMALTELNQVAAEFGIDPEELED